MDPKWFSTPVPVKDVTVTDAFWQREMELVRKEVIPYQWEALNDRVPDAEPSWCMHNFRAAARLVNRIRETNMKAPSITPRGFQILPGEGEQPDPDSFYGFLFQDSDFYKWIEAVAYSLAQHPDPELEKVADAAIDIIHQAQMPDGYLDTYYILHGVDKAFTNLKDNHELYCLGHLAEGAVAYYQATGKDKLLQVACRYADHVAERFGPEEGKCHGYPGHELAEMALVRLSETTGEDKYRQLASYFIDERGKMPHYFAQEENRRRQAKGEKPLTDKETLYAYHQADVPVREQPEAEGHAVRAMYLYSGMADIARLHGDDTLLAACERLWNSAVEKQRYITGGVGATAVGEAFTFPYDLPNDTAYSETCAAIGLMFFARRMLQIRPDSRYGDVMEQALYNTVLAGMALDGKSFFYVNPLEVVPERCHKDDHLKHVKPVRQKWFGCACCPPNIARLVSSLPSYTYTVSEDTLYTHLYVGGEVRVTLAGQPMTLAMTSGMPGRGDAQLRVVSGEVQGTLAFRLPGWCDHPQVVCPGKELVVRDGYAYLTGLWREGDTVALTLPMQVRVMAADSRVREDAGQVALTRGPITYCAEEADNGPELHLLRLHPAAMGAVQEEVSSVFGHDAVLLKVPAARVQPREASGLYAPWQPEIEHPFTLTMVPYYAWANRGEGEMRVWLPAR
ncbi:MAG: glycoside hydrolase family 127 protein [Aristaeellaceae bacterium]